MTNEIDYEMAKFFDEEGSIVVRKGNIRVCMATPDKDQIERFAKVVGYGSITKQSQCSVTLYVWSVYNTQALSFLSKMLPYLTARRKVQAEQVLGMRE